GRRAVVRPCLGVDGHLAGVRAIGGGDARGDAFAGLDRDREGRLERGFVLRRHEVEPELVAALGRERQADQPAPLLGHEVDRLRGHELGRDREIALVLAIGVIAYDHHLAQADLVDRALDRGERCGDPRRAHRTASPASRASSRRSRCLASTSTSRFTAAPSARPPRLVRRSVSGISDTEKPCSPTALTVRLTPSTATEPFSTIYRASPASVSMSSTRAQPSTRAPVTVPVPST